jgi:glyoxylase-like metal-dependent hydrolase (beta-lactamase superfamily II)
MTWQMLLDMPKIFMQTAGSVSLLYNNRFLFSGDHLWWDREFQQIGTPERLVWDNAKLEESVRALLNYSFEWVLPGHGERLHLHRRDMKDVVEKLFYRHWPIKKSRIGFIRSNQKSDFLNSF